MSAVYGGTFLSFFLRRVRHEACDACAGKPMLDRSTADALSAAKTEPAAVEFEGSVHVEQQRLIARSGPWLGIISPKLRGLRKTS